MLPKYVILLLVVINVVSCQIDGEFWWLHKDITKLQHKTPPIPTFDNVNELDTDETAKVVFRDVDDKKGKSVKTEKDTISAIHFKDETELAKPSSDFLNINNKLWERPLQQIDNNKNNSLQNTEDEFRFVFPSDGNLIWADNKDYDKNKKSLTTENKIDFSNKISYHTTAASNNILFQNEVSSKDKDLSLSENICTFIKKEECIRNKGTWYNPWTKQNMTIFKTQVVCCILPIATTSLAKVIFPDNYWGKRHKRSEIDRESSALNQRNNLMSRKYASKNQKTRMTTPSTNKRVNQKIANSNEPTDPYWNIKNSNIRNPDTLTYQDPDLVSDYESHSYGDDYTVELPKPGLIGLYSDHRQTQSIWPHNKNKGFYYDTSDSTEEEEFETSFGYSTVDPRRDHHLTSMPSKPFRLRPLKLTAASRIPKPGLQNPTITFYSKPDFQVLEGFKLLNLMRSKNRFVRKTSENNKESANNGLEIQEIKYKHDLLEPNLKYKLFNECGKSQKECNKTCENRLGQGVVEPGGHPWIALVVLTESQHTILCYATIVHSRVAVSVADCVYGQSPGSVSIIAGVLNLNEDRAQSQRRMTTITHDPDYTPGNFGHNLALLHWIKPLIFDARIQPACLGDPQAESSCVFTGWGGYDQEMHSDLQWQRASILAPQNCNKLLSKLEVSDALCAAVESRGTVTGVGGPLLCKINEQWSVVAVAVWRNDIVILLPQRAWVLRNMIALRIQ